MITSIRLMLVITITLITAMVLASANTTCPISGRPVKADIVLDLDGTTVAFCCNGCKGRFAKMSSEQQQAKLAAVAGGAKNTPAEAPPLPTELALARVYVLPNCPISGEPVGSMDAAAMKVIGGREIMFCCPPCIGTYEADQATFDAKIDAQITEMQLARYPLTNCLASGRPIEVKGTPTNAVYGNRLMRFCCGGCADHVIKNPRRLTRAFKALDEAYAKQQGPSYSVTTCVVSGEPLGDSPVDIVVGDRLVRTCCRHCGGDFKKNPGKYLSGPAKSEAKSGSEG